MYHAQGCCNTTCKAPSCVPGELPSATASEHFKASDHQASESISPTVNTLPLHHYTRQHNRAKHPWRGSMSSCHFCLTLAFPDAYTVPQLTLRPTRCCCQHSVRKICSLKRKHRCSVSPFSAWPTTLYSKVSCHLDITPCLEPSSSTKKTEADYILRAVFHYVRYRKNCLCRTLQALSQRKQHVCKHNLQHHFTQPNSPSCVSVAGGFAHLSSLSLYNSILLYNNLVQDQNRKSNSLLSSQHRSY